MATVTFDKASRLYPGAETPAVDQLDLSVGDGEFLVLVGPSGCGKSTSLRMLAGLEEVTSGNIYIGDRDVTDMPPKDRDIAMVFQNYALYPHMSVADNMGFALKIAGVAKDEIRKRVEEAAKILDLTPYLDRKPKALSGGQRQRVAMGRAIVRSPQVFLMDEPLSNLDAKLRVQTRTQIASLQRRLGVTTVYVTHDQVEAMTMGDRVAVLKDGILQQVDSPRNMYDRPNNVFVAGFIGSPAMNLLTLPVNEQGVQFGSMTLPIERSALAKASGNKVIVGVRPEDLDISDDRRGPARAGRRRRGARRRRLHLRDHRRRREGRHRRPGPARRGRHGQGRRQHHRPHRRPSSPDPWRDGAPGAEQRRPRALLRHRQRRPPRRPDGTSSTRRASRTCGAPVAVPARAHRDATRDDGPVSTSLQITSTTPEAGLLDLPWELPLETWPEERVAALPRGISRHVVRFVRIAGKVYAVKEITEPIARREYQMLRNLRRLQVPSVEPTAVVSGRHGVDGEHLEAALITRHLQFSLPYRALFSQTLRPETATRLIDALAVLLVRLHLTGLLLGRRLAVEHAVPPRRRRVRRLPGRRRDRRAARRRCPTASAPTTSTSPG